MKIRIVSAVLAACLLFGTPLQLSAAQSLPAGGITTTVSDGRYIDSDWMNQALILTYQGQSWAMGLNLLGDYPVFLSDDGGVRQCVIGDSAVIDVFLSAINEQLKGQVFQSDTPIFDTGTGSYILNSGQTYYQLNNNVKVWILTTLQQQFAAGTPQTLTLELTDGYLTPVVMEGTLTYSPDFVLAGTCTTGFSTSSSNRINNIEVAAGHLNNLVVMPGQEISVSDTIKPRTTANGYKSAGAYLNGRTVPAIGGGICQVSSTVYNAVKNAGLTVLERHPHSMPVHYLPLGLDAAISAGSKDLRFRNDYSAPVILQAYTEGKNLIVNCLVWNHDLNGRTFKLWSKETGSLSAKTYFTTYQDGVEVSTEYVGASYYMAPKPADSDAEDE
ncbi:MAG TPA: VanW family protein [Candidatus Eisenbergiella intestinigallinarum]|uniref:VanW family protein n=1 Tax=Candidatus Eisenbergiella intestinigallinarum TaxID=2838549 RepID=A0A9D2QIK8_9FIRM|nr:VanW family protein [Candidatus Eisenbergiella intestinigallinarum]